MRAIAGALAVLAFACTSAPKLSEQSKAVIAECSGGLSSEVSAELRAHVSGDLDAKGSLSVGSKHWLFGAFLSQGWDQEIAQAAYNRYVDCVEGRDSVNETVSIYESRASRIRRQLQYIPGVDPAALVTYDGLVDKRKEMLRRNQIAAFYTAGLELNEMVFSLLPESFPRSRMTTLLQAQEGPDHVGRCLRARGYMDRKSFCGNFAEPALYKSCIQSAEKIASGPAIPSAAISSCSNELVLGESCDMVTAGGKEIGSCVSSGAGN